MTAAFCIFLTFVFQNKNVFARSTSGKKRSLFTGCQLWTSLHKNVSPLNQNISRSHNRRRFLLHGNKSPDESAHLSSLARAIQNIIAFRRSTMCEQPESSDESAHLSSLARIFATPIQNISAFRSHRQFRHAINRLNVQATKAQTSMRI